MRIIKSLIVIIILLAVSCIKDPTTDSSSGVNDPNAFLTVEEAQVFFEDSFMEATRSGSLDLEQGLFPTGDYTPVWDEARSSENEGQGSVDVPILSSRKYRAIRSEFKHGRACAYMVNIEQKLIVVKSKETDKTAQYILTLIPDREYYRKNNSNFSNKFLNSGDKDGYSGYALYTCHGTPIRLNKYKGGKKIMGVSVFGAADANDLNERINTIVDEFSYIAFQYATTTTLTRTTIEEIPGNNWHIIEVDGEYSFCYCLDSDGNPTCGNNEASYPVDPDSSDPDFCTTCYKMYYNPSGEDECVCNKCQYCKSYTCLEMCQTCSVIDCTVPYCQGECLGYSNDIEMCDFNRCSADNCSCCIICEGECKAKCLYNNQCHEENTCICCSKCEGICKVECLNEQDKCHVQGSCSCQ